MKIVDLRNVPVVVEVGPNSLVAEFYPENITAEALVGPTVVEFSWGELIPGPGLKGGGPFRGKVYIDQDIPGLPEFDVGDTVNPAEDLLMLYDASTDTHRKVYADLGGGGNNFDLTNVGTGARVHKDTIAVGDQEVGRLRSLVSSNGTVYITETADEIDFGVAGNSFSAFPDTLMIATSTNICSNQLPGPPVVPVTLSYTPAVDTPDADVGHLAIFIAYFQGNLVGGDGSTTTTGLTGWTFLVGTGSHMFAVWYKFLTLEDLNTTHTVTLDNVSIYKGCRDIYVLSNVNQEAPFYAFVTDYYLHGNRRFNATVGQMGAASPAPALAQGQHVLTITHSRDYNASADAWSDMNLIPLGEMQDEADYRVTEHSFPYLASDAPCMQFRLVSRKANVSKDQNLIPGETLISSMQDPSWDTNGVLITRPNTFYTAIEGTGAGPMEHYAEQTLNLTAGEKVTFYVYFREESSYPNAVPKMHMYIVDPNDNKRGVWGWKDGGPVAMYIGGTIDTAADLYTNWHYLFYKAKQDGNPSMDGGVMVLYLTAPTTGDYRFRFGPAYGSPGTGNNTSFTASGGKLMVTHTGLRKGYHSPRRIWTPNGPVINGSSTGMVENPGYLMDINRPGVGSNPFETQQWTMVINPAWPRYPIARVSPDLANIDSPNLSVNYTNGEFIVPYTNDLIIHDEYEHMYRVDKYLHPTIAGAPAKYYWEARVLAVTDPGWHSDQQVGIVGPLYGGDSDWASGDPGYNFDAYADGDGGWAINDIVGVSLDYAAGQVKFYRNNVLKKTIAINPAVPYAAYTKAPPSYMRPQGVWGVRLREPFTYAMPAGHVPYDITGDADFQFGSNSLNLGGGAEIVIPGSPDTYRTLLSGAGISVTQEAAAIRIAQDIPDLPLIGNGIADRVGDTLAIYDASAGIHKRITPQQIVNAAIISGGGGGGGGSGGGTATIGDATTRRAPSLIPVMTSNTAPSGTASASNEYTGLEAWRCLNQDQAGWLTNNIGVGAGQWIRYQFALPQLVKSWSIIPWSHDTWPGRVLTAFKLQGSNDGTNWTDIDSRTDTSTYRWTPWAFRYFSCASNVNAYTHYRLFITGNGGNGHVGCNQWEIYDTDVTTVSAGGGGAYYEVTDVPPSAPDGIDSEFETLEATNGGWGSQWTARGGTPTQATQASSCLIIPGNAAWQSQTISGSAWRVQAKMMHTRFPSNLNQCSVLWAGVGTTKQVDGGFWKDGAGSNYWCGNRWNSYGWVTRLGSTVLNYWEEIENWFYLELEYNGTNLIWKRSRTGIEGSFWTFLTEAQSSHLGAAPDKVGININRSDGSVLVDWFRRVA